MPSATQILHNQSAVLLEQLVHIVNRGLEDPSRGTTFKIDYIAGCLARHNMQKIGFGFGFEPDVRKDQVTEQIRLATNTVFEQYARHVKNGFYGQVSNIAPPMVGSITAEDYADICRKVGFTEEIIVADEGDSALVKAWKLARANNVRYLQRMGALAFLKDQCDSSSAMSMKDSIDAEMDRAHKILLAKATEFWADELQFAMLCGGSEFASTQARMMEVAFSDRASLARYVSRDGVVTKYDRFETQALRDAINVAAGKTEQQHA